MQHNINGSQPVSNDNISIPRWAAQEAAERANAFAGHNLYDADEVFKYSHTGIPLFPALHALATNIARFEAPDDVDVADDVEYEVFDLVIEGWPSISLRRSAR